MRKPVQTRQTLVDAGRRGRIFLGNYCRTPISRCLSHSYCGMTIITLCMGSRESQHSAIVRFLVRDCIHIAAVTDYMLDVRTSISIEMAPEVCLQAGSIGYGRSSNITSRGKNPSPPPAQHLRHLRGKRTSCRPMLLKSDVLMLTLRRQVGESESHIRNRKEHSPDSS